jgi:hypothetical protein
MDAAEDSWREILREAVAENGDQASIGTHFRSAVNGAAAKRGLRFPPDAEPDLKFIQLLQRYPDVVTVMRRPGQDFLVAPAGRSDLFAHGVQGRLFGIRKDLFEAFSVISDSPHYFEKVSDRVIWRKPEADALPESWVTIPPVTLDHEIQLRRDFAESLSEQAAARSVLLKSLDGAALPLQSFGKAVRDVGVQREWHTFRTERLVERIQRWAKDAGIAWKDAWLTEGPTDRTWNRESELSAQMPQSERDALHVLFSGLDAADIQRIAIPLDLVLKAISSSRKPS